MGTKAKKCTYDPTALRGLPIGMFHCPECGEMQLAGLPHLPSAESEMNTKNPNTACEHGHQRRVCPDCELDELRQQRDAALKLADKWEKYAANFREQAKEFIASLPKNIDPPSYIHDECADELRAIFAPKEGK